MDFKAIDRYLYQPSPTYLAALKIVGVFLSGPVLTVLLDIASCGYVASQRAARLRGQLDELARILREEYEASKVRLFQDTDTRKQQWADRLTKIITNAESAPARFVFLNNSTMCRLRDLFPAMGAVECGVLKIFGLEPAHSGNRSILAAIHQIESVRDLITIYCFLENPRSKNKYQGVT